MKVLSVLIFLVCSFIIIMEVVFLIVGMSTFYVALAILNICWSVGLIYVGASIWRDSKH